MPIQRPLTPDQMQVVGIPAFWARFGDYLTLIDRRLNEMPNHISFSIRGFSGQTYGLLTVPDLRHKFANISWRLTGGSFDNGGVGQIVSKFADPINRTGWLSAEQETNIANFKAYAIQVQETGLIYLALHEAAHVTEPGIRVWSDSWSSHQQANGTKDNYPNSPPWNYNEQFANSIVAAVCDGLDLTRPRFHPNPGYLP